MSQTSRSTDTAEILIAEVHHRFFNSLQVISSLANGLAREGTALAVRQSLAAELLRRIAAMSELHHMLAEPHGADLQRSCETLCETLTLGFGRPTTIYVVTDAKPISTGLARGVMLILAELVTNAMKHAPTKQSLDLAVSLERTPSGIDLAVSNPLDGDAASPRAHSLPRVAQLLAERLGGALRVTADQRYLVEVWLPFETNDGADLSRECAIESAAA